MQTTKYLLFGPFCACLILVGYQIPDCSTFCFTPSLLVIAGKISTNRRCQGSLSKHLMSHLDQPVKIVKTRMLFRAAYLAFVLEASHPSMCSQKFVLLHLSLAEAGSLTNRLNRFVGYVGFILGWPGSTIVGFYLMFRLLQKLRRQCRSCCE